MKTPSNPVHLTLPNSQQRTSIDNINMNHRHVFWTLSRHTSGCILLGRHSHCPGTTRIASSSTECYFVALFSHYSTKHHTIFTHLYFCLHSLTSSSSNMEAMASQVRNHYSQKNHEAHLERALARALKQTANHRCGSNIWTSNPAFEYRVGDC